MLAVRHSESSGLDAKWVTSPSAACSAVVSLFGVALGMALLTTVIVTFVLVPGKIKNGTSAAHFFRFFVLVQHNANSFLLLVDLLLSNLHVRISDVPFCYLFGIIYCSYHHYVRYPRTRTVLYFFLNWQWGWKSLLVIIALLSAMATFLCVGVFISEVLRPTSWGP